MRQEAVSRKPIKRKNEQTSKSPDWQLQFSNREVFPLTDATAIILHNHQSSLQNTFILSFYFFKKERKPNCSLCFLQRINEESFHTELLLLCRMSNHQVIRRVVRTTLRSYCRILFRARCCSFHLRIVISWQENKQNVSRSVQFSSSQTCFRGRTSFIIQLNILQKMWKCEADSFAVTCLIKTALNVSHYSFI